MREFIARSRSLHPRLLGALLLLAASPITGAAAAAGEPKAIVVVIDGAKYTETFGDPLHRYIPHIWNDLRPLGAMHTGFYNRGQTVTPGAHASMLTGGTNWIPFPNPRGSDLRRPSVPTLFEYLRAATGEPAETAWMVANYGMPDLEGMTYSNHPLYGSAFGARWDRAPTEDEQVANHVLGILSTHHPRLLMVNLHGTDRWGHAADWNKYTERIKNADRLVFGLWQRIQEDPFYTGQTTLIITSDHGRHTRDFTSHGDCCKGCQHVAFLALGPSIRPGVQVASPQRRLEDLGPTLGRIMGIPMPYVVDGRVMTELLTDPGPPPEPYAPVAGLTVEAVMTDEQGNPRSVFPPGAQANVVITVRNTTGSPVSVYQQVWGISDGSRGPCPLGKYLGYDSLWLQPGGSSTSVRGFPIPPSLPGAEYSTRVEARGVDGAGALIHGEATVSFTVAP